MGDDPRQDHLIDFAEGLVDGVHTIRIDVDEAALRTLADLATKAVSSITAYRQRMADFGGKIGKNQHVLGPLTGPLASLHGELERLSEGTVNVNPLARNTGLDFRPGPTIKGTDRHNPLCDAIMDLIHWSAGFEAKARTTFESFPEITEAESREMGSIAARLDDLRRHDARDPEIHVTGPTSPTAIKRRSTRRGPGDHVQPTEIENVDSRAVAHAYKLLKARRAIVVAEVARAINCNRSHLYQCKGFLALYKTQATAKVRRGRKEKDGSLEAWDEEE